VILRLVSPPTGVKDVLDHLLSFEGAVLFTNVAVTVATVLLTLATLRDVHRDDEETTRDLLGLLFGKTARKPGHLDTEEVQDASE